MTDVKYLGGNPICDVTARAALDGLGDELASVKEDFNDIAPAIIENVSGAVASFVDGADGRTVYKFRIPNKLRPDRTVEQPTPEEVTEE